MTRARHDFRYDFFVHTPATIGPPFLYSNQALCRFNCLNQENPQVNMGAKRANVSDDLYRNLVPWG